MSHTDHTLPHILTPKEVAEHLKVSETLIQHELETGKLHGFKIGDEWRCTEQDALSYIQGVKEPNISSPQQTVKIP